MSHKITKREFLIRSAVVTAAACVWEPLSAPGKPTLPATRRRLSLAGNWLVSQADKADWIPAVVPGCVHTDLLAAGRIPDPFFRDNEKAVQWVGETNWIYQRSFDVPEEVLSSDRVSLRCEGLDTLAVIKINGKKIGLADNMFRQWEFDVKSDLQGGKNIIEILFEATFPYFKEKQTDQAPAKWVRERAWLRKEPCSYGWDWGPVLATCGIWRNICLETFNQGRIRDVLVSQNHLNDKVELEVELTAELIQLAKPFKAALSVFDNGHRIASAKVDIINDQGRGQFEIKRPKLWWPAGMGKQPLYEVEVKLIDDAGNIIDTQVKRIGLRTLKILLAEKEKPLQFEVNGVPFFAKGANWIPADSFANRVTPEILRQYMTDAAAVHMNMLRFWGGGYYEEDVLYDACDELGICVWLDFKFACAAYPAFDDKFMENVKLEARDNLQRLRHHPCIAVWCGNNEISLSWWKGPTWDSNRMSTADYDKLFKDLLGSQVQKYAPQANYVSGSPDCGDTHYWDVWHGPKLFDAYRTQGGFMSEFGYQSFPEPKTVHAFTNEADRASVVTPAMAWHQRSGGVEGNQKIVGMILNYFQPPRDFETTLWLSQIMQGYGIKTGAEYWRQTMPKSMGCVFWQYNDTWPGMSWASVDYFGRWKALHYLARKFYAPVLVSGLENLENGTVDIFVTSDRLEACQGILTWKVTDLHGKSLAQAAAKIDIPARNSQKIQTLDVSKIIGNIGKNEVLTWLQLTVAGEVVSENLVLLALPKEMKLSDPKLAVNIDEVSSGFLVTVKTQSPALWTWLDLEGLDAKYADNFFHVKPTSPVQILVRPAKKITKEDFAKGLRVRSLFEACLPT